MSVPAIPSKPYIFNPLTGFDLDIFWDVDEKQVSADNVVGYNVYRAEGSPSNVFVKINSDLVQLDSFRDFDALQGLRNDYYYRITAVNDEGESYPSEVAVYTTQDLGVMKFIFKEIIRRTEWILDKDRELVDLYIRKRFGKRCSCYDAIKGQGKVRCSKCFGTFYQDGYIKFENLPLRIVTANEVIKLTDIGLVINRNPKAWTSVYPLIHNRDVIVTKDNKRFFVQDRTAVITRGYITRQEFTLMEIETTDVVYQLGNVEFGSQSVYRIPWGYAGINLPFTE